MLAIQNVDMTGFNAGLRGLAQLGIPMRTVVQKETGELIKTLVKTSPAADAKTIRDSIKRKFEWLGLDMNPAVEGQKSKTGLEWVGVNEHFLTGIDPTLDMRDASVEELKQFSYNVTKRGRIKKPFTHSRTKQQVLILTKVLTKKKTVVALANAKAKNRGRLKASWLTAVRDGVIKIFGANMPPAWVTRHANWQSRGYWRGGLDTPNNPNFTIASYAVGLTSRAERGFIQRALDIRAKAMVSNVAAYFKGKKNVSDYSRL